MFENFEPVLDHSPLFKSIFDNATANAIQIMDEEGYILYVNETFTHFFGYTKEDIQGKHTRILFTEEDQAMQMPEMEIEKVNQHGTATDKNYTVHKNGSCIWVSGESILAKDEQNKTFIIKFIQDIHQQKLLEKFLKESKEFSEGVVRSITDAVIVLDLNFRILKANNAFYYLFRINLESVEGLYLYQLSNNFLTSDKLKQQLENIVEGQTATQFQLEWKESEVTIKHFSIKASFIDSKLVNKRIVLVINDITDKVTAEQQRDDLLAFVIHELRNPLANISMCLTLLEEAVEEDDKEGSEIYLDRSKANIQRLKSLIQELYDATQAGSGNLNFNKRTFNFEELLNEVIETVQLAHASHVITKTGEAKVELHADRERIGQVFSNYLLNAIKYSPEANRVDVQVLIENNSVVVAVTDYGLGIAEDKIPHVFERYYRADNSKKIEGLGLGLYLSKQIIDVHNGRVWITSKVNEGSTFYFSIPK